MMIDPALRAELLRLGLVTAAQLDEAIANVAPKPAAPAASRTIGPRAIALLHHFEGCKLTAYKCPAGIWTIGWGNTFYANGTKVQQGDSITQETADALFKTIVAKFENGVVAALGGAPATNAEFGAMVSLAYNIGLGWPRTRAKRPGEKPGFNQSSVLRLHLAGDKVEAADAFLMWNKSGGKVSKGLVRRRDAERLLYLNDLAAFDRAIGYKP